MTRNPFSIDHPNGLIFGLSWSLVTLASGFILAMLSIYG